MVYFISVLNLDLWPNRWSFLENIPCALEQNECLEVSLVYGVGIVSSLMFCLPTPSIRKMRVPSPAVIVVCLGLLSGVPVFAESLVHMHACTCVCVCVCARACTCAHVHMLSPSLVSDCNFVDYSPLGSSVHGVFQARILEGVASAFSRGTSSGDIKLQGITNS